MDREAERERMLKMFVNSGSEPNFIQGSSLPMAQSDSDFDRATIEIKKGNSKASS